MTWSVAWVLSTVATAVAEPPPRGLVVFSSNRVGGEPQVFVVTPEGKDPRQLTTKGGRCPSWSHDGRLIAYTLPSDRSTHVMRADGSDDHRVCPPDHVFQFWEPRRAHLVCTDGGEFLSVDAESGAPELLLQKAEHPKLGLTLSLGGISRDGRWLVGWTDHLLAQFPYDNGTHFSELLAAVAIDRTDPAKLYFVGPGCGATLSPTEDRVYHVSIALQATRPDIFGLDLADLQTRSSYAAEVARPDEDWGHEYMVRISTDGKWLSYAATTGCHDFDACDYEIFLHRLGAPESRWRVTTDPASDQCPHLHVEPSVWTEDPPPVAAPVAPAASVGCAQASPPGPVGVVVCLELLLVLALLARASRGLTCRRTSRRC